MPRRSASAPRQRFVAARVEPAGSLEPGVGPGVDPSTLPEWPNELRVSYKEMVKASNLTQSESRLRRFTVEVADYVTMVVGIMSRGLDDDTFKR